MEPKRYLIAIPCAGNMPTQFVAALTALRRVDAVKHSFLSGALVYDARAALTEEALETGADRILWLDSDMFFSPDLMQRTAARIDAGAEMVCGLYFTRSLPTRPCIYKSVDIVDGAGHTQHYCDFPKHGMFTVAGCGFGAVMMTTDLLRDIIKTYPRPFDPMPGILGEDLAFCWRARQLGHEIWCDADINVGHVGSIVYTEAHYLAQK